MELDDTLTEIGPYGRYQLCIWGLVTVFSNWPFAWQTFVMTFLGYEPDHACKIPVGFSNISQNTSLSVTATKCNLLITNVTVNKTGTLECDEWTYKHEPIKSSIVTEWNLVCDNNYLAETAQAVYAIGILAGDLIWGMTADRYGRKIVMFATLAMNSVVGAVMMFSPNVVVFLVGRTLLGVIDVGFWLAGYLIILEIFPPKQRTYFGIAAAFGWNSGALTMALLAYFIRDWKILQLVISVPSILTLCAICFIPESVRWLHARGRQNEVDAILMKMAKFNGTMLPENTLGCKEGAETDSNQQDQVNRTYTTLDLFRTPKVRLRTICLSVLWIVNTLVYYGLSFSAPSLNGDLYLNFLLLMVIEVPSVLVALFFTWRIGRRIPLMVFGVCGGIACIVVPFIPESVYWLKNVLSVASKFGINASFTILVLYTTELFPTVIRSNGGGLCSMAGRIGGLAFPYINYLGKLDLGEFSKQIPFILYGVMAILGSLLALPLIDTKDKRLPDTIEELEGVEGGDQAQRRGETNCDNGDVSNHTPISTKAYTKRSLTDESDLNYGTLTQNTNL